MNELQECERSVRSNLDLDGIASRFETPVFDLSKVIQLDKCDEMAPREFYALDLPYR